MLETLLRTLFRLNNNGNEVVTSIYFYVSKYKMRASLHPCFGVNVSRIVNIYPFVTTIWHPSILVFFHSFDQHRLHALNVYDVINDVVLRYKVVPRHQRHWYSNLRYHLNKFQLFTPKRNSSSVCKSLAINFIFLGSKKNFFILLGRNQAGIILSIFSIRMW